MLETAQHAARKAAKILMENFGKVQPEQIRTKSQNDFLSYVDEQSEKCIIDTIHAKFPDHAILAEESGISRNKSAYCWIIDPLDGTKNYIKGIPVFAVSIAVQHKEELLAGVVFDPLRNEMFSGQKGAGAWLNGKKLLVSKTEILGESLLGTGFPFKYKHLLSPYINCFEDLFLHSAGMRRFGAAAIDLAYVAAGRFEGFWELGLSPWDVAAGALLITEAGGQISDFWGKNNYLVNSYTVASNGRIQQNILQIINKYFPVYKSVYEKESINEFQPV